MPADSSRAVFLSYASQDAEAARRICETLRSAGVEVWFDADGGLEHGDEWDAKIRRQIKECVLFIPVISAHTQARHEGYFRIEWELAAQRAMGIASGIAFILPVVIDDTREPEALVPDRFRAVQWTKLRGGEVTPEVKARFLKLWSHRVGVVAADLRLEMEPGRPRPAERGEGTAAPVGSRRWLAPAIVTAFAAAVALVWALWQRQPAAEKLARAAAPSAAKSAAAAKSMSPEVASVYARIQPDLWRPDDYSVVASTLDRLIQTRPDESDAWALRGIIASLQVLRNYDYSTKVLMEGKADAERALRIAPASPLGELALGMHYVAMMTRGGDPEATRVHIERGLAGLPRDVLTRYAEMVYLAFVLRLGDSERAAQAWLKEVPDAPFPLYGLGLITAIQRRAAEAESWSERAAKDGDSPSALRGLSTIFEVKLYLRADLAAARATLDRVPPTGRSMHRLIYARWLLALMERKWDEAIRDLARVPNPVLYDRSFHGPKSLLAGIAHRHAGRAAPAAAQFGEAERTLRELLAGDADNEQLRGAFALTLACAGRAAEARAELASIEPLVRGRPSYFYSAHIRALIAEAYAVLGDVEAMLPWLRLLFDGPSAVPYTPASFRLDPRFENVVNDARVQALLLEFTPAPAAEARLAADPKSVAVLPFANQSDDKANEYFSDGIAEELLTVLQKIPGLRVAARTSAWSFKGKNPTAQEVGEKLGMAHVVEGSVQKIGNRAKITARLSRAATNEEVWSKSFGPIELTDVFATQSEIAQAIVGELRGRLTGDAASAARSEIQAQVQAAQKGGTKNTDAHLAYLQGQYVLVKERTREGYTRCLEHFQRAVTLDPGFALAWAALAAAHAQAAAEGFAESFVAGNSAARAAAQRALGLEPELAEGHAALAKVQVAFDFDWLGGKASTERALALAPGSSSVRAPAVWLAIALGDEARCLVLGREAVELDPLNVEARSNLSIAYWIFRRYAESEAEARRVVEVSPTNSMGLMALVLACFSAGKIDRAEAANALQPEANYRVTCLALIRHAQGRRAESSAALAEMEAKYSTEVAYQIAEVHALHGAIDQAFAWLEKAYAQRDSGMTMIKHDPLLQALHRDARWAALLKKMNLGDTPTR